MHDSTLTNKKNKLLASSIRRPFPSLKEKNLFLWRKKKQEMEEETLWLWLMQQCFSCVGCCGKWTSERNLRDTLECFQVCLGRQSVVALQSQAAHSASLPSVSCESLDDSSIGSSSTSKSSHFAWISCAPISFPLITFLRFVRPF